MRLKLRHIIISSIFTCAFQGVGWAGPPASCAGKFIGTWSYPGGTTTVSANGMAYPHCAMCVPTQSWTCQGNTYLFSNSGPPGQFTATLVDANHMSYGSGVATRVGGRAAIAATKPESAPKSEAPKAKKSPSEIASKDVSSGSKIAARVSQPNAKRLRGEALGCNPGTQEIAGCIDIPSSSNPGISGARQPRPSPAPSTNTQAQIAQANSYMQAALTAKQSDPSYSGWSTAASQFRRAAEAFKAAGDLVNATAANDQAQTLETALKLSKQDTRANHSEASALPTAQCSGGDTGYPDTFWQAGNLNQRYGSSWSCKMISLVPQSSCELYNSCVTCMNASEDFYQDSRSAGHCVARAGGGQSGNSVASTPVRPTLAAAAPKSGPEARSQPSTDQSSGASGPPPLLPPGAICEGGLCGAAGDYPPPPPPPNGACNWNEAKINLEWVLQDTGAKATYFMWRGYRMDPVHALIQAQAHNRHAQQTLVNCFSGLADALANIDPTSRNPVPEPLSNRKLSLQDCHCITIVPTGENDSSGHPNYTVRNSCIDAFMMTVTMLGSVGSSKASVVSNSEHEFLVKSQQAFRYSGPDSAIVSIGGWVLRDAASRLQCIIPQ